MIKFSSYYRINVVRLSRDYCARRATTKFRFVVLTTSSTQTTARTRRRAVRDARYARQSRRELNVQRRHPRKKPGKRFSRKRAPENFVRACRKHETKRSADKYEIFARVQTHTSLIIWTGKHPFCRGTSYTIELQENFIDFDGKSRQAYAAIINCKFSARSQK